jgi:hypothetical protein
VRFDCFDDVPHYHYLDPRATRNMVVEFDTVANGPMPAWALQTIGARLPEMLAHAGATNLASSVDAREIGRALPLVAAQAERVLTGEA